MRAAYPDMFIFRNSLYQHPFLNIGIKDGRIEVHSFDNKKDTTEFTDIRDLSKLIIELRDELREQERLRESQSPAKNLSGKGILELLEEQSKQPLHWVRDEEPPVTTVQFSIQASALRRTVEDHRRGEMTAEALRELLPAHLLTLIENVEQTADFTITVTHVINKSTTVTSNHSPNCS
jgi:hypothetical protein